MEAAPSGGRYEAVLPRPTRDVSGIVYYLEALDRAFSSFRTEEFRPRVVLDESDCEEDETRPAYVEGPAAITVGATVPGSSCRRDFVSEGIAGAIVAGGRAAGSSTATIIGVGAAAGAAAGVGVLVGGSDSNSTTRSGRRRRDDDHFRYDVRRADDFGSCEQRIRHCLFRDLPQSSGDSRR